MGDNKPQVFHSPNKMYLVTCWWEVHKQKIRQDVHLPLIGCRLEVHQDVDLMGNATNYGVSFISCCKL